MKLNKQQIKALAEEISKIQTNKIKEIKEAEVSKLSRNKEYLKFKHKFDRMMALNEEADKLAKELKEEVESKGGYLGYISNNQYLHYFTTLLIKDKLPDEIHLSVIERKVILKSIESQDVDSLINSIVSEIS